MLGSIVLTGKAGGGAMSGNAIRGLVPSLSITTGSGHAASEALIGGGALTGTVKEGAVDGIDAVLLAGAARGATTVGAIGAFPS